VRTSRAGVPRRTRDTCASGAQVRRRRWGKLSVAAPPAGDDGAPLLVDGRTGDFTCVADGVVNFVGWARREPDGD